MSASKIASPRGLPIGAFEQAAVTLSSMSVVGRVVNRSRSYGAWMTLDGPGVGVIVRSRVRQ